VAKDCWTANIFIKVTYVLSEVIRARASSSLWLVETKTSKRKKTLNGFVLFFLCLCFLNVRLRSAEYRRLRTRTDDREETPQDLA
jgi:hypothetical protein